MKRFGYLLLGTLLLPLLLAFEWPGRLSRLKHELERGETEERREAARQLGGYRADDAGEALRAALEDPDPEVRMRAAVAAGRTRARVTVPILTDWLDDPNPEVRATAAQALGQIAEPRSVEPLARLLSDARAEVRLAAVGALAAVGGQAAVMPLLSKLDEPDTSVRVALIEALARIGDGRALTPLMTQADEPAPELRLATLRALGKLGDARALPLLTGALSDERPAHRHAAIASLGQLALPQATAPLVERLQLPDPREAQLIVAALGQIGDAAALSAVIEAMTDRALHPAAVQALHDAAARERLPQPQPPQAEASIAAEGESQAKQAPQAQAPQQAPARRQANDGDTRAPSAVVTQLVTALRAATQPSLVEGIALGLQRVSAIADTAAATEALLAQLDAPAPTGEAVATALAMTGSEAALEQLLMRLDDDQRDLALSALAVFAKREPLDSRAADPLLAALPTSDDAQRLQLVELLSATGARRAVPALIPLAEQRQHADLRRAAIDALGTLGGKRAAGSLLRQLIAPDQRQHFTVASALGRCAQGRELATLIGWLEDDPTGAGGLHVDAVLVALGPALNRHAAGSKLTPETVERTLAALDAVTEYGDGPLRARVLDVLQTWHPPQGLQRVASALRSPSTQQRTRAARALSTYPGSDSKPLIRYLLSHAAPEVHTSTVIAVGETGDYRDLEALMHIAQREHWPLPGAVAYALNRMAQRGVLRPAAAARSLCELGQSREPYVRANVASAMAWLGAGPCRDGGPSPIAWLQPQHGLVVRLAAAHWLWAAVAEGVIDAGEAADALLRCQRRERDPSVAAACAAPPPERPSAPLDLYAFDDDGRTQLRNRLVAVRFEDGSVLLAQTDVNAHLLLPDAPGGAFSIEDPTLQPLEAE